MNFKLTTAAVAVLAASLFASNVCAVAATPAAKKHVATKRAKTPPPPTVQEQIQSLRQEMEGQINGLKTDLAAKDEQLKQAQQAAAEAQAAADKAQAAATAQQQSLNDNAAAVDTLKSSVSDLKGTQASLATTISDETSTIKKEIASPEALHYKGVTISPAGSFLAAESVYRSGATGGGINTPFTSVPLQYADDANISEFQGSGRQSRLAIKAVGKLDNMTLTGYYELDWLGTGITSNNNQSNSYVMRQRQIWAEAALKSGWTFSGGQMWSLAAETTKGTSNGSEILPGTIDPQYTAGFVWTRQYGFRVSKEVTKGMWLAASAENAETLNPAGSNLPSNLLIGSAGTGGGLYNSTANYSFNVAPDFVVKAVFEPGWGHYEIFGLGRFFRDRIYPAVGDPYNNTTVAGGIGGGFRVPLADKKLTLGLKGLWGQGVGRYGDSTIADVTIRPDGSLAPLRAFSALSTLEASPTKRLSLYANYGGDYVAREYWGTGTGAVGYGIPGTTMSGCNVEVAPSGTNTGGFNPSTPANCKGNNKDVQEATFGYWYNFYNGPKGRLRTGIQYSWIRRDLWSGVGGGTNPNGGAYGTDNIVETSLRYYLP
jgi:Skp family chaperone for outer membrane proteins